MVTICPAVIALVRISALVLPLSTSSSRFTVSLHPTVASSGVYASLLRYQNQAHNWPHTVPYAACVCVDFHVEMKFALLTRTFYFYCGHFMRTDGRSAALQS